MNTVHLPRKAVGQDELIILAIVSISVTIMIGFMLFS